MMLSRHDVSKTWKEMQMLRKQSSLICKLEIVDTTAAPTLYIVGQYSILGRCVAL